MVIKNPEGDFRSFKFRSEFRRIESMIDRMIGSGRGMDKYELSIGTFVPSRLVVDRILRTYRRAGWNIAVSFRKTPNDIFVSKETKFIIEL